MWSKFCENELIKNKIQFKLSKILSNLIDNDNLIFENQDFQEYENFDMKVLLFMTDDNILLYNNDKNEIFTQDSYIKGVLAVNKFEIKFIILLEKISGENNFDLLFQMYPTEYMGEIKDFNKAYDMLDFVT